MSEMVLYPLVQLFLFTFGVIGMTHIIVDSSLFAPARDYLKGVLPTGVYRMLECYQCCGTWSGFVVGLAVLSWNPVTILICGCAGSFLASWAAFYLSYLEAKTMIDVGGKENE